MTLSSALTLAQAQLGPFVDHIGLGRGRPGPGYRGGLLPQRAIDSLSHSAHLPRRHPDLPDSARTVFAFIKTKNGEHTFFYTASLFDLAVNYLAHLAFILLLIILKLQ